MLILAVHSTAAAGLGVAWSQARAIPPELRIPIETALLGVVVGGLVPWLVRPLSELVVASSV